MKAALKSASGTSTPAGEKKAKVEKKKEPEEEPFVNTTPKGEKKGTYILFFHILLILIKS